MKTTPQNQLGSSLSPLRTWQVWRRDGWRELDPQICRRIDKHDQRGDTLFQVEENGRSVWIDTEQLVAKDPETGTQRSLRVLGEDLSLTCPDLRSARPAPLTRSISITVHRPPLFQVYMDGEWRNLPEDMTDGVNARVAQGEAVFNVFSRGNEYRIDLNQMYEYNLKTNQRWRLRRLDPLKILAAPTSPMVRSPETSRPWGWDEDNTLALIRRRFREFDRPGNGRIAHADLKHGLADHLKKQQALDRFTTKLLDETVKRATSSMRLGGAGISLAEWTHYWLLRKSSPNAASNKVINDKLSVVMDRDRGVLERLLALFEEAGGGKPALTKKQLATACQRVVNTAGIGSLEQIGAQKILDRQLDSEDDATGGTLGYYDFCMAMLGRKPEPVQLYCYDLAGGKAPLLAPLVGQYWEGVWHTGVVVYGKEYWYGGRLFESVPGTTAFGKPTRIVELGQTLRTKDELWELLTRELAREYTVHNYDVLTHNCNHFTDELSRFLLNEALPEFIACQGTAVMDAPLSRFFRPMMNMYLGRFETAGGGQECRSTDAEVAEQEWSQVTVGTVVLLTQHDGAEPVIAEVLNCADGLCDVRWIDLHLAEVVEGNAVTKAQVKPLGMNTGRKTATPLSTGPPIRNPSSALTCSLLCPVGN